MPRSETEKSAAPKPKWYTLLATGIASPDNSHERGSNGRANKTPARTYNKYPVSGLTVEAINWTRASDWKSSFTTAKSDDRTTRTHRWLVGASDFSGIRQSKCFPSGNNWGNQ